MRAGLVVRERRDARAVDDVGQQRLCASLPAAAIAPPASSAAEEGLDHQAAAQLLEDHGDVEAAAAEAALFLVEQRADHAELGELLPDLGAEAAGRLGDAVARLEGVLLGDEAVQRVGQHAAVFGVFEVHRLASHSPRIILEMMFSGSRSSRRRSTACGC